jgi:periplasmic protein TonB
MTPFPFRHHHGFLFSSCGGHIHNKGSIDVNRKESTMLEQSMVVSRLEPRSRLVFLPAAAALHAAVLTAAMVAAVWNVSLPSTPPPMRELWVPALAVALPPPPPPPPASAPAGQKSQSAVEGLAPVTTPIETTIEAIPSHPSEASSKAGSGSDDGRAGGQEGGVPDGVEGSLLLNPVTNIEPAVPVRPVRPGGSVSTPVNLVRIEPVYPELAKKIGAKGLVVIECVIARDGSVRDPKVVRGAHPLLDKAALEAVRQWKFAPGRMGERPVDVLFNLTVTFELQ